MRKIMFALILLLSIISFPVEKEASTDSDQLIIINKRVNELAFYNQGKHVKTFKVATGKTEELTPEGIFKIVNKIKNRPYYTDNIPGGDPKNPLGDRWLGLNARGTWGTTYAIHGNSNPKSIGQYVSAGCVRMYNDEIRWLFDEVKLNTPVHIVQSSKTFNEIAESIGYFIKQEYVVLHEDKPLVIQENGKLVTVGKLHKGQTYVKESDYGNWHRLQYGHTYAFVHKTGTTTTKGPAPKNAEPNLQQTKRSFRTLVDTPVYDNSSGSLVRFATIQARQSYPIVSEQGNWYIVKHSGRLGYVAIHNTDHEQRFFTMKENAPIYTNDTGSLVKVGELIAGQTYERVSQYGNWHKIQYGNGYAFVHGQYTTVGNGLTIKNLVKGEKTSKKTFTAKQRATVYDNTSGQLIPFATLEAGKSYPIISDYGANWYKVSLGGRIGYVAAK